MHLQLGLEKTFAPLSLTKLFHNAYPKGIGVLREITSKFTKSPNRDRPGEITSLGTGVEVLILH